MKINFSSTGIWTESVLYCFAQILFSKVPYNAIMLRKKCKTHKKNPALLQISNHNVLKKKIALAWHWWVLVLEIQCLVLLGWFRAFFFDTGCQFLPRIPPGKSRVWSHYAQWSFTFRTFLPLCSMKTHFSSQLPKTWFWGEAIYCTKKQIFYNFPNIIAMKGAPPLLTCDTYIF